MVLKQYLIPGGTTLTDHCHKGGRQVIMPQHRFTQHQVDGQLPSLGSSGRSVDMLCTRRRQVTSQHCRITTVGVCQGTQATSRKPSVCQSMRRTTSEHLVGIPLVLLAFTESLCAKPACVSNQAAPCASAASGPDQSAGIKSRQDDSCSPPSRSAKPAASNDTFNTGLSLPARASEPLHDRTMYRTQYQDPLPMNDRPSGDSLGAIDTRPLPSVAYRTTYGSMSVQNSPLLQRQHTAHSVSERPRVCDGTRCDVTIRK